MVAAVAHEPRVDLTLCCPNARCQHRHLATIQLHAHLPARMVWARVKCQSCKTWRWYDVATGELAPWANSPLTISK